MPAEAATSRARRTPQSEGAFELEVGGPFRHQEHERENRQSELNPFGTLFVECQRLLTPRGGGTMAKAAHLPERDQINQSRDQSNQHHGDANGIGVEVFGQRPCG